MSKFIDSIRISSEFFFIYKKFLIGKQFLKKFCLPSKSIEYDLN
ncbi:hypothetical protein LEP1GSC172_1299 [Leptospira noguchii]|uniref:Uncharacterized protein n=2 Tax=Leptospira noguchii TaxID=28182 RepID=T0GM51_9LEPT|nr:hypothetical protein LEP1GSC172_1299 [Leptospira noguchii]EQA69972.1 hypothetical protein LEP1GSC059_2183 [Leptospira noguchii serovar Panama str. CZ214]